MEKLLRIGLCGFGNMGKAHAYAVRALPYYYPALPYRAEVAAVCASTAEHSRAAAEHYGLGVGVASPAELMARPDIDIIDICTPNTLHADTVRAALAAGKHVLCEKPLCLTAREADELVALEKAGGKTCGMVFNNRYMAPVLRAKELIDEGRLGRLLSFRVTYEHNSSTFPDKAPGWKQLGRSGGGVLMDLGPHALDLVHWFCGDFDEISGFSQIAFPSHGQGAESVSTDADEAFYMTCRLQNGACGTITVNKLVTGANDDLSLLLSGTAGSVRYRLSEPEWLWFYDASRPAEPYGGERGYTRIECCGRYPTPGGVFPSPKATVGWLRCHIASMEHFLSDVAENRPHSPSLAEGAYIQRLMETALESDRQGGIRCKVTNA